MKTNVIKSALLVIIIAFMSTLSLQAQELHPKDIHVPDVVKQALNKQYPNAKEVEWVKTNGHHEAEFLDNNISVSMLFDRKGNIINKKTEISFAQYPEQVKTALDKDYLAHNYKPLSYMKRTEEDDIIYETLLVKGRDLIVVKYDPVGKFISKVNLTKSLPLDYFPTN